MTGRLLAATLLVVASLLFAASAFAHASLLSATPADGTTIASAPASLSLQFNEQVAPVTIKLIAPDGREQPLTPTAEGARLDMPVPAALSTGTYALSWRVISDDGHPVGGTTTFSIGAPSGGVAPHEQETVDWPVRLGIWTARVLTYAGLFIGIGGIFFVCWLGDGTTGLGGSRIATIIGLIALPFSVGLQGLDALDQSLASFFMSQTWQEGMSSSFGLFVGLALLGLALALVATARVGYERLWSLLALVCAGLALAMTGHASTSEPQWLTRPAIFVHTSVVGFWAGSLLLLAMLLRGPAENAVAPLRRFSASIPPLLLLLLAAGVALAVVQVTAPGELLTTDYGRVLIAKTLLVIALLGVAAFNRWRLTGGALVDAGAAGRQLVRLIGVELLLVLAIFGVVALWRFTPPPRALLEAAAQPVSLMLMGDEAMAEVVITPGHAGPVSADITLMSPSMASLKAEGVTVDFGNKNKGIEPIERQAKLQPDGTWRIDDLTLPVGGLWQVEVDVLVSDFKEIDLTDQVEIRP